MAVVELEGLTKRFGDAVALDGLTLSIARLAALPAGSLGLRQDHVEAMTTADTPRIG